MPNCPPTTYKDGNAAVLIHYVKNQPDHVTFCGWFLQKAMFVLPRPIIPLSKPLGSPETLSRDTRAPPESIVLTKSNRAAEARDRGWNTDKSVNGLRDLATEYSPQGVFNIRLWRNKRLMVLPRSGGLRDIDVSIGFDTFLTSVVGQHSPGYELVGDANFSSVSARTHLCRWLERNDRRCRPRANRLHPSSR